MSAKALRHPLPVSLSLAAALALAAALRAPWLSTPLGNDEGGLAYIAGAWHASGPFLYGDYFIDRPPLLLSVFRLASETGGTATVRTIGVVAALALVALTTQLARDLGGDRAARWAAALAAVLVSSVAFGAVFTPAELLAVLPSTLSVLFVWRGVSGPSPKLRLLFAAGALALCASLVKQSFADALIAGFVCLAASAWVQAPRRRSIAVGGVVYASGILSALAGLEIWEHVSAIPDGSVSYALLGFRLDGLSALAGSAGLPGRFAERLLLPLLVSGLGVVLVWSAAGMRRMRERRVLVATLGAWGLAGTVGVLAGGSYWGHYLIQLIPFAAVTASVALAGESRRRARATAALLCVCAIGGLVIGPLVATSEKDSAAAVGAAVGDSARPSDTVHVLYSQADILYYSGLRDPFPYHWSLMMRAVPGARAELRALLASPRRPTWVIEWEAPDSYELDRDGRTARLLARHYRGVAVACGAQVLLRNGARRRFRPPAASSCGGGALAARG